MREINGADAGSLHRLRFKLTHNDSMEFPFSEITMPITETSTAGYVAMRREVINLPRAYEIPPGRPYRFNTKFDQESGYRTRSMLTLLMKNSKGEVLGLLVHSFNFPNAAVDRARRGTAQKKGARPGELARGRGGCI